MKDPYVASGYSVYRRGNPTNQEVVTGLGSTSQAVGVAEALNNAYNLGRLSVYENRTEGKSMFESVFGGHYGE